MRFALIFAIVMSALAIASPIENAQEATEMTQAEALDLVNQFAAMNDLTQTEAIALLQQIADSDQEQEFLPFLASLALPFAAKGIGALVKKIAPGSAKVVDKVTGILGR